MDANTVAASRQSSLLIALAHTLLARGASKVWLLGGGAAAVTRRCEILQASVAVAKVASVAECAVAFQVVGGVEREGYQ